MRSFKKTGGGPPFSSQQALCVRTGTRATLFRSSAYSRFSGYPGGGPHPLPKFSARLCTRRSPRPGRGVGVYPGLLGALSFLFRFPPLTTHYSLLTSPIFCHITPFLLSSAPMRENANVR
jgi:hypothetical protein